MTEEDIETEAFICASEVFLRTDPQFDKLDKDITAKADDLHVIVRNKRFMAQSRINGFFR